MISHLPRRLKPFQRQAAEILSKEQVKDIEFSGGTYQVLVHDEWAFLQLDAQGRLKDSFCSCSESEEQPACVHQAAALLYIYGSYDLPLHQRFEQSLWNQLGRLSTQELGSEVAILKKTEKGHTIKARGGKSLFSIHTLTPAATARLNEILYERTAETEETSLKFSNLSQEEIVLWEQGAPPLQLAYELSFWNDLAKWLMELQEEKSPYTLSFDFSPKQIPNRIKIAFPEVLIEWSLSEEMLTAIIPSLATVNFPLAVHSAWKEIIEKITYHEEKKCFIVTPKTSAEDVQTRLNRLKAINIGDWAYVPHDGFYAKHPHFLLKGTEWYNVEELLNEHVADIKPLLQKASIKELPTGISYVVSFDDRWNLHIISYLLTPGDLLAPGSHCFGSWLYVTGKGFFRTGERDFAPFEKIIAADDVADFINENRAWLNTQQGFHTHLSTLESNLSYRLEANNTLSFSRHVAFPQEQMPTKDFGRWVYLEGYGFFSKVNTHVHMPLRAGTTIPAAQISMFIRLNRDDLHFVKGFFSVKCPVAKAAISIKLISPKQISVTPEYTLLPEYQHKEVRFFEDFAYVEGEGFSELTLENRLPEGFASPTLIENDNLPLFIETQLPKLIPAASYVDPKLLKPVTNYLVVDEIEQQSTPETDGYALKLNYQSEYGTISLTSLWWALHQNQRYLFTEAGLIDLAEQRYNWLRKFTKKRVDRRNNLLNLSTLEVLRLNALEGISAAPSRNPAQQLSLQHLRDLTEFRVPQDPDLTGLQSHLRPYQLLGVRWLWFLYHHKLSGLLCDDMGLGKTHQTMGLIAAIINYWHKQQPTATRRHFLIVCPTSVIYHWQEKLRDFLPSVRVWTFYGIHRRLDDFYQDCDILLTSYGIWRNEIASLSQMPFEVAIFDELQIAKNHMSRIYSALLKANAKMRLGLTGTPIENRLRELKALFDIVLPTYLPAETDYREFFVRPIEKEDNKERRLLLSRMIKPFVLRRKKEDVLLDLPEKTEEIAHCDLLPDQLKLYVEVLTASRDKIINDLNNDTTPVPYMHIFALLSHLKQICNHPAAYLKKADEYQQYQSGKWELFIELLEEARESQQKIVVFSQYLNMLDIIENYLTSQHIGFAAIRGKTTNRGEQLTRFNSDPTCEVFVASLQAVGLGVDLTAGSVVIHYDRWWNAARENQATDRVHRIGQTRGVQVFKLISKGTIEEHIDFLIHKKGRLLDDVVSVDDHQIIKKFDREEIISLLQFVPKM